MFSTNVTNELLKMLPGVLHANACVAGSYATPGATANDIDVWITGIPKSLFPEYTKVIRQHLIAGEYLLENAPLDNNDMYESSEVDASHEFQIVFHGFVDGVSEDVHIILSSAVDLPALLEEFDLSIHQAGYRLINPDALVIGKGFTRINEQPRILSLSRPNATRARVERIFSRYGFVATSEDIMRLLHAVETSPVVVTNMAGERHVLSEPLFFDEDLVPF